MMPNIRMIKSVIKEYGISWLVNRVLYSLRLKMLRTVPLTEGWYEKKAAYPKQLDIFDIDIDKLRLFIQGLCMEDKDMLVRTADKACEGIIKGFSSLNLDYGNPIDWQLNPLTGSRFDEENKWFQIPDFDKERGDIKVIWEASRFSHFITLARAYLLTTDEKYYRAFSKQLSSWLKKNTYSYGANFKCGQECALRMVNTLLAFTVFRKAGIATDVDRNNVQDLIDRCYRKILSNFFYAYKCIKNNHTISELMGMIVGAWCCDDEKQLDKAYILLNKVIDEQFTEDGGYCQFSFNYQRLALQDLECVLSIEEKAGRSLSQKSKEKIKSAAQLLYQCQDSSGDMPNYGSNDGALVFPLTSCGYRDFRPVINTTYALITGKQLYEVGKHQEELIWFSREKKLNEYHIEQIERVSSQFVDAGLFTIRDSRFWMMIISNDYHSRPAHMDQHHIDLWIDNENVLCDAGTYSYASELGIELAKNVSHNTAVVDEVMQMNSGGHFMIYNWTKRKLYGFDNSSYEGETVSGNRYIHKRTVKKLGSTYEIIDRVDRDFRIFFHTPCEVILENGKVILGWNKKNICEISSNGEIEISAGERSLYYLKRQRTTCIVIKGQAGIDIKTIIKISGGNEK